MQYQAVIFISDAEDSLEAAKLLAPLEGVEKVKVVNIGPRPEPRVTTGQPTSKPPQKPQ